MGIAFVQCVGQFLIYNVFAQQNVVRFLLDIFARQCCEIEKEYFCSTLYFVSPLAELK